MGSIVLLDLMGGVALLLWGLHMVLSGVLRAFGPDLRRFLGKALRNRLTAFAAGVGLTALLQSSTATGLMTASLGRRRCQLSARARDYARRQCWHDIDRTASLLQYRSDRAGIVRHRPCYFPRWRRQPH